MRTTPLEGLGRIYSTCKTYSLFLSEKSQSEEEKIVSHNKVELKVINKE